MLDELMREPMQKMHAAAEKGVEDYLRFEFGFQQRVSVHAPWWMPQWLYRRLMRSILIEQTPVRINRKAGQ